MDAAERRRDERGGDLALTRRAAAGDQAARRELATRLLNRVRQTARYLVHDDHDADDVAQTSLVDVLRGAGGFRGEASLESWADRITVHNALRWLRKRRPAREPLVDDAREPATPAAEVEDRQARRDLARHLSRVLQRLSPERRAALLLKVVYQYELREIAALLEVPLNTVRDRLQVGRRQMRAWIVEDQEIHELAGRVLR